MADLRHLLAIYVHAHRAGNAVPPHIDADARTALAAEPPAPTPAADAGECTWIGRDGQSISEREWLADWIENEAPFEYGSPNFARAAALLRQPAPAAARPAPTPDDFRRWWRETGSDDSGPTPEMLLTANAWAEAWAAMRQPAPAPVPVPVDERLPQAKDCKFNVGASLGSCWCWNPPAYAGSCGWWSFEPLEFAEDATHWLPHWAIPQPPQGGEVEA